MDPVVPIAPASAAARAYRSGATAPTGFSDMVGGALRSSLATLRHNEVMSARGAAGQADVVAVVEAAVAAELTVQAVTQIRDRAVSAYQDILRMPV